MNASSISGRVLGLLTHPRFAIAAVVLAIAIALPTIGIGFYSDDYVLLARIRGRLPGPAGLFDLYRLTPPSGAALREMYPWWSSSQLQIDFFRPLSSALLWLDHAVFQLSPLGYHVHSLAWYAATAAAVVFVNRRALPGAAGALASLAFILDDAHIQPVGWIACRNALVSAAPALFGLGAYLRYRDEGRRRWLWLALLGLGAGLAGGEGAMGAVAYVAAYELVGRTGAARDRLRALGPILALTAAYLALYAARGHGAAGNDYYFAPTSDPVGFLRVLVVRAPILIADAIVGAPTDIANLVDPRPFVALGLVCAALLFALYRALRAELTDHERRALRWLSLGAFAALIAAAGAYPGSRLLVMPGVGAFGVIAVLIRAGLRAGQRVSVRAGCVILGVIHFALSPLSFLVNAAVHTRIASTTESAALRAEVPQVQAEAGALRWVFVLVASDPMAGLYAGAIRALLLPGEPERGSILSMARSPQRVSQSGASSIILQAEQGSLLDGAFVGVFRSRREPMAVGDRFEVPGATVVVRDVALGAPTRIEVHFALPLEDERLTLLVWRDGLLRRLPPPALGESRPLEWSPGPIGLF